MGFRVYGVYRVWGLGFEVWSLEFWVSGASFF